MSMENDVQPWSYQTSSRSSLLSENSEIFSSPNFFNEVPVERSVSQKHLGLHLDQKLDFIKHINDKISKVQKGISVIKKLYNFLPRNVLLTYINHLFERI